MNIYNIGLFKRLFGNGKELGINLCYESQDEPNGIAEAFIIGSTVGMSAVGLKPIVEVQFADYIWPGLNQLFTEVSRSNYLSNGKWPVSCIIRVPIGAYGSGGGCRDVTGEAIEVEAGEAISENCLIRLLQ